MGLPLLGVRGGGYFIMEESTKLDVYFAVAPVMELPLDVIERPFIVQSILWFTLYGE